MSNRKCEIGNGQRVNVEGAEGGHRLAGLAILALLAFSFGLARAQANSAVVAGAAHVFIRRGPGTEFPPFATLAQGTRVEVQEMHGEWARVLTASGQSGYVNSNFLAIPGEHRAPPAAAPARAVAPARSEAPSVQQLTEQNQSLTAQIGQLQQELANLKARAEATPAAAPTTAPMGLDVEKLQADVTRLTAAVEQLEKRLDVEPPRVSVSPLPSVPADGPVRVVTSTTILLAAIGLCVGWLLGNAYGRRQERARRPRVRL
jgi:outer membrane murein-binding lipoprotein Lpp